jgi:hypothetical protein
LDIPSNQHDFKQIVEKVDDACKRNRDINREKEQKYRSKHCAQTKSGKEGKHGGKKGSR